MTGFSHLDDEGHVRMVNVSTKNITERVAVAEASVVMERATRQALFTGDLPKGDALAVARVAAIMGAKKTADLIPLCHPLEVTGVEVSVTPTETGARVEVLVRTTGRTGVEMEAITGASLGAIALYDMIKSRDRAAEVSSVRLLSKTGGKSGNWSR
ncbi:cyclic pyranopterin monophosphate synthase MoaC [bacterium]|nr:cyclic pyranopterin monophosphate synthase MoaC [bacterium]